MCIRFSGGASACARSWLAVPESRPGWSWRYEAAFRRVAEELALSQGFVLLPVEVLGEEVCDELARWLGERGDSARVIRPRSVGWPAALDALLHPGDERILMLWGEDGDPGLAEGLRAINLQRDRIRGALARPLLWCGAPGFLQATLANAPDWWSIRDLSLRVEAVVGENRDGLHLLPLGPATVPGEKLDVLRELYLRAGNVGSQVRAGARLLGRLSSLGRLAEAADLALAISAHLERVDEATRSEALTELVGIWLQTDPERVDSAFEQESSSNDPHLLLRFAQTLRYRRPFDAQAAAARAVELAEASGDALTGAFARAELLRAGGAAMASEADILGVVDEIRRLQPEGAAYMLSVWVGDLAREGHFERAIHLGELALREPRLPAEARGHVYLGLAHAHVWLGQHAKALAHARAGLRCGSDDGLLLGELALTEAAALANLGRNADRELKQLWATSCSTNPRLAQQARLMHAQTRMPRQPALAFALLAATANQLPLDDESWLLAAFAAAHVAPQRALAILSRFDPAKADDLAARTWWLAAAAIPGIGARLAAARLIRLTPGDQSPERTEALGWLAGVEGAQKPGASLLPVDRRVLLHAANAAHDRLLSVGGALLDPLGTPRK